MLYLKWRAQRERCVWATAKSYNCHTLYTTERYTHTRKQARHLELNSRAHHGEPIKKHAWWKASCCSKSSMNRKYMWIWTGFFSSTVFIPIRTAYTYTNANTEWVWTRVLCCSLPQFFSHRIIDNEPTNVVTTRWSFSRLCPLVVHISCVRAGFFSIPENNSWQPIYIQWSDIELWTGFPTTIDPSCIIVCMHVSVCVCVSVFRSAKIHPKQNFFVILTRRI